MELKIFLYLAQFNAISIISFQYHSILYHFIQGIYKNLSIFEIKHKLLITGTDYVVLRSSQTKLEQVKA